MVKGRFIRVSVRIKGLRVRVRPRRRRFEAFTIGVKIIRLIRRRVALFPTAAARQFFDGDCDAANNSLVNFTLSVSLKHNGNTSPLGLFDCSLSGPRFLFVGHANNNNCKLNCLKTRIF